MSNPVIVVTDLYQPPEDPGDNFDLLLPYGYAGIDLRAIVLDVSVEKRDALTEGVVGYPGPREPGIIPIYQLNALFGVQVPYGTSPFVRMRSVDDAMRDVPRFQQAGPELILETLLESDRRVDIMSFGSARPIAVALNRDPNLFASKVGSIHLNAGSTAPTYLEWNVYLDPLAITRLVTSGLSVDLYPCATGEDCYAYGRHNTLWWFEDLQWICGLAPPIRRYLLYALSASKRIDFLRVLDDDIEEEQANAVYSRRHAVWETAAWIEASSSAIVRHADGTHEILGRAEVSDTDVEIRNELVTCDVKPSKTGLYTFRTTTESSRTRVFTRNGPRDYELALREALPRLYASFDPPGWQGSIVGRVHDGPRDPYAGPLAAPSL